MARGAGNKGHRHPDAADCLEGLGEESAVVVRPHDGGFTRHWLEGGEVRSRDVAADGLPTAGGGWPAEFGLLLPRLAADLGSGVPDLDAVERALRDAPPGGSAEASVRAAGRDAAGRAAKGASRWAGRRAWRVDAGSPGCGSSAPEHAGRRGAPTPCARPGPWS